MTHEELDEIEAGDGTDDDFEGIDGEAEPEFDLNTPEQELAPPAEAEWFSPIMGDGEAIMACGRRDVDGCPMLDLYEAAATRLEGGRVVPKVGAWVGRVRADIDENRILTKHGRGAYFLQLRDQRGRVLKQRGLRLGKAAAVAPAAPQRQLGALPAASSSPGLVEELRAQLAQARQERDSALVSVRQGQVEIKRLEEALTNQRIKHLEDRLAAAESGRGAPRSSLDDIRQLVARKREFDQALGEIAELQDRAKVAVTPEEQRGIIESFAEQASNLKDIAAGLKSMGPLLGLD